MKKMSLGLAMASLLGGCTPATCPMPATAAIDDLWHADPAEAHRQYEAWVRAEAGNAAAGQLPPVQPVLAPEAAAAPPFALPLQPAIPATLRPPVPTPAPDAARAPDTTPTPASPQWTPPSDE